MFWCVVRRACWFEETWKFNADKHLPGWSNGFNLLEDAGNIFQTDHGVCYFKFSVIWPLNT